MASPTNQRVIVLDMGTMLTRVGWAGDEEPVASFPTVVGIKRDPQFSPVVGSGAFSRQKSLQLIHPLRAGKKRVLPALGGCGASGQHSRTRSGGPEEDMEAEYLATIWRHSIEENLGVPANKHPVLLADSSITSRQNRETMLELLLHDLRVPAVCIKHPDILSLRCTGSETGLVITSGEQATTFTPIVDGRILQDACAQLQVGGEHVTDQLFKLFKKRGILIPQTEAEMAAMEITKKELCFVLPMKGAVDPEDLEGIHRTAGGIDIIISKELYECAEVIFQPHWRFMRDSAGGVEESRKSISQTVADVIRKCPPETQDALVSSIVLAGGNSHFVGFSDRLTMEVMQLMEGKPVNMVMSKLNSTWHGGSMLASMPGSERFFITIEEFDARGRDVCEEKWGGAENSAPRFVDHWRR